MESTTNLALKFVKNFKEKRETIFINNDEYDEVPEKSSTGSPMKI